MGTLGCLTSAFLLSGVLVDPVHRLVTFGARRLELLDVPVGAHAMIAPVQARVFLVQLLHQSRGFLPPHTRTAKEL